MTFTPKDYLSDRVFDGVRPLSPEESERLRKNYMRTHSFFANLTPEQQAAALAEREIDI